MPLRIFVILLGIVQIGGAARDARADEISPERKAELIEFLKANWQNPEDYVVGKFSNHSVVFLGEYHRIKHDVELVHRLIPRLHEAGIHDLGIEFGCFEDQENVDRLITADEYDEDLARQLTFRFLVSWGFQEYMDIYRRAWELNSSLPDDAPKFRIVHLGYRPDWGARTAPMTREALQRFWHKGDPDEHMAQVVLREFVEKERKALVYAGVHHAFTRYQQPIYDYENRQFVRFNNNRMGNIVYKKIRRKAFNIFLHSPWQRLESPDRYSYPAGGVIDDVMKAFDDRRVGFDVAGSPFGDLKDEETYYAAGYMGFRLRNFCDGYIFQRNFRDYEGCTVDPEFVTEKNFGEVLASLPDPQARERFKTPGDFMAAIREEVDVKKFLHGLE